MSYDFALFQIEEGIHPEVTAARLFLDNEDEWEEEDELEVVDFADTAAAANPGQPDLEAAQRNQRIANRLIELDPTLVLFQKDFEEIARLYGTSVEEAQIRFRDLELNKVDGDVYIQISLFDESAGISTTYYKDRQTAIITFKLIWGYFAVFKQENFAVFDPQIGEVLNLDSNIDEALNAYLGIKIHDLGL
jgi:hypothetical protein